LTNNSVIAQFEEINGRLIESRKAIKERDRILSLMTTLDEQLASRRQLLAQLTQQLQSEQQGVAELERLSLTAVVNKLFGSYEEKLEQEVAEYLQAKMDVEACRISINSLEANLQEMDAMLVALANCDKWYAQAEEEQKQFLIQHGGIHPNKIMAIPNHIGELNALIKELDEALTLTKTLYYQLRNLVNLMNHPLMQGIGRVVLLASQLQPQFDLLQAECQDVNSPLIPYPNLQIPRYSDVMPDVDSEKTVQKRLRRIQLWRQHLEYVHNQLEHKYIVLLKIRDDTAVKVDELTQLQAALIHKWWDKNKF